MKLFFREYGSGEPLVILHGLLGSSDNWLTQAKMLAPRFKVFTVDLRNHGQSPHDGIFDYPSMVDDLVTFFDDQNLSDVVLIGHSMGGKVAMNFALQYPDRLRRLVVVDIAPRAYNLEHYKLVEAMLALPLNKLSSRKDADTLLEQNVPHFDIRQFLLKNLQRTAEGGFSWKVNLPIIHAQLDNVGADLWAQGTFDKPTLFIRGSRSEYIRDSDWPTIQTIFPIATLETLDTGHWVQAEKPQEFVTALLQWIDQ